MQKLVNEITKQLQKNHHYSLPEYPSVREWYVNILLKTLQIPVLYWITDSIGRAQQLQQNFPTISKSLELEEKAFSPRDCFSIVNTTSSSLHQLLHPKPGLYCVPQSIAESLVPPSDSLKKTSWHLEVGQSMRIEELQDIFSILGMTREYEVQSHGQYAVRGGVVDCFPESFSSPLRIELEDNSIASLRFFDPIAQLSIPPSKEIKKHGVILENTVFEQIEKQKVPLYSYFLLSAPLVLEIDPKLCSWPINPIVVEKKSNFKTRFTPAPSFHAQFQRFIKNLRQDLDDSKQVTIISNQGFRINALIRERFGSVPENLRCINATVYSPGWIEKKTKTVCYTDYEIFGVVSAGQKEETSKQRMTQHVSFIGLTEGCYVTHVHHGIGRFLGISVQTVDSISREYLTIEFAKGDKIFVPISKIDLIAKYLGSSNTEPKLSSLHDQQWRKRKQSVGKSVASYAKELLHLYSERSKRKGFSFPPDDYLQKEIALSFPFLETEDQQKALKEVMYDMESDIPMDRLVCGDVGFGKTEIALRAAVKAVSGGKQVALLAPTTILAEQHYKTFHDRLKHYPFTIGIVTRLQGSNANTSVLKKVSIGGIDIIIGTHRLLQKDVSFHDLGLLIIDEEQRFGVKAKEMLRDKRVEVDTLSLSATPIPRTLHLALSGIRAISVLQTPPMGRQPVQTICAHNNDTVIRNAIVREINRQGQVFIVYNQVQSMEQFARKIAGLVPEARVSFAHGQMKPKQLEEQLLAFTTKKTQCLVASTIIENGIDIPSANTIIVIHANHFGLSDLYQLRGRVGRSNIQAYAYFLHSSLELPKQQKERLNALIELSDLGSGFEIAVRDLDMRGAGDVFGTSQSGNINEVGFELYCRMVKAHVTQQSSSRREYVFSPTAGNNEINDVFSPTAGNNEINDVLSPTAKNKEIDDEAFLLRKTVIDLPVTALIPSSYIVDSSTRLKLYQQIGLTSEHELLATLQAEVRDRFGHFPPQVDHLWAIELLRIDATNLAIDRIYKQYDDLIFHWEAKFPELSESILSTLYTISPKIEFTEQGLVFKKFFLRNKTTWLESLGLIIDCFR